MSQIPQLCLGTVQFGIPYGITNQTGQVQKSEVHKILQLAAASRISLLDTANSYGTAETLLGQLWPKGAQRRIISKLPSNTPKQCWEKSLMDSLQRLQTQKLDSYILHNSSDLLKPNGMILLEWLESLRERGLVERIGISIYEGIELDSLPLDRLQLVQLPLSVYDQRLLKDGTINKLQENGIAIHVRSVMLQGLLLQQPKQWPNHLSLAFKFHHARWLKQLQQEKMTALAGALGFVQACKGIEAVLVGVLSTKELQEILQAWNNIKPPPLSLKQDWAWENNFEIDPRRWPQQ